MTTKVEPMLVSWLKPDPNQPRKNFEETHLRNLGESLRKKQLYPLLVGPDGMIYDGECRWRAAQLAQLENLDVIILPEPPTPQMKVEIQLVSALHRSALTPFEQATGFRDWLRHNPGATAKELAGRIDRDQSGITKYLSVFDCSSAVQEAAATGKIGPSAWYPISLLPEAEQGTVLSMYLAGMPRDQIAEVSKKRRTTTPGVKSSRVKCLLSGGVNIVVTGDGITLDDLIEHLGEAQREAKKAREQSLDVKTFQAVLKDKSKKAEATRGSEAAK